MTGPPRFISPGGLAALRREYDRLMGVERPQVVEIVSWAASLGDRSENADYLYGKKRLREIDRRLGHLARVMKAARVVDPAAQVERGEVRFGATVTIVEEDGRKRCLTILGDDEADTGRDEIGWSSPVARALIGARVGDERSVRLPAGERWLEVLAIAYPQVAAPLAKDGASAG